MQTPHAPLNYWNELTPVCVTCAQCGRKVKSFKGQEITKPIKRKLLCHHKNRAYHIRVLSAGHQLSAKKCSTEIRRMCRADVS